MAAVKTLIFLIAAPGTVTVLAPWLLINWDSGMSRLNFGSFQYLGWAAIVSGGVMIIWSMGLFAFVGRGTPAPFDPPQEFVARGFYRYLRNPMYSGILLILAGEFLVFGATILLVYGGFLFLAFHSFVVYYEEPTLTRKFGDAYREYCQRVPRWAPRLKIDDRR